MLHAWKTWARGLKHNIIALSLAARDPRVPVSAKIMAVAVVAYALSPLDLIPDFIPILGYLDDLILLPMGIALTIRLIPKSVWDDCCRRAIDQHTPGGSSSRAAAIVIVALWLIMLAVIGSALWK